MTHEKRMENRVLTMTKLAETTCNQLAHEASRLPGLQCQDVASVLALATAMSIVRLQGISADLATEMSASAIRTVIKNLMANGIEIGDISE